jgi:hypothetical protein
VHSGKPGATPPFLYRREGDKASTPNAGSGIGFGRSVATLGNTHTFTTESFVGGAWLHAGVGHAEVVAGRDLLLSAVPDTVSLGEILSVVATQLPQGTPFVLLAGLPPAPGVIHQILGAALLPQQLLAGSFQSNETVLLSGVAPVGLSGLVVLIQVAAKPVGENVRVSDIQSITF